MRILSRLLPRVFAAASIVFVACGGGSTGTGSSGTVPTITSQPANQSIVAGASAVFTVAADGSPSPTLAWERSNDGGATWSPVSGVTSATYTFTAQLADNGAEFRALATNGLGTATSNAATLMVTRPAFALVIATGASGSLGGVFTAGSGWTTTAFAATNSGYAPGLAITGDGTGVGVIADPGNGLLSTIWTGTAWSTPTAIGSGVSARSRPAVCQDGASAALVYQDASYHYYFGEYSGGTWNPSVEPVGSPQSYGPAGPDLAVLAGDPTIAFLDGSPSPSNDAAVRTRVAGSWSSVTEVGPATSELITPTLVAPVTGPELLLAYEDAGGQIRYCTRSAGTWSTPAAIPNALTGVRAALTPLADGSVLLAFCGTDNDLYWCLYSGGSWSTPAPLASPNQATTTAPALAPGIGTATAELAFIQAGAAYHARLISGAWTTPVLIGTSVTNVAIASAP